MTRTKLRGAAGVCLAGVMMAFPVFAQWRVVQEAPEGLDRPIAIAIIENDSGHNLRFFSDENQILRGVFTIRDGFDTIDPGVCPTYRVDELEPARVGFEQDRCHILPKQAEFTLGPTSPGENRELRRIMQGSSIVFRYRLGGGNYRETRFSLRGSKYALTTAIQGPNLGYDE